MKKGIILVTAVIGILGFGAAQAEDYVSMFEYDVSLDYYSNYIWRGQNLTESVFQPGLTIRHKDMKELSFGIWGNWELTNERGQENSFTEVDYTLDYTIPVSNLPGMGGIEGADGVDLSVGMIYYNFGTLWITPNGAQAHDTAEFYWGLTFNEVPFTPAFTIYYDVDEADGGYYAVGSISHTKENIMELGADMPVHMVCTASMGYGNDDYNRYYWGTTDGAINDVNLSLAFPTEMAGWTLTPSANWTMVVDSDLRDTNQTAYAAGYDDSNCYFYVGIGLSKTF